MADRRNTNTATATNGHVDEQFAHMTQGFARSDDARSNQGRALVDIGSGINVIAGLWLVVAPWVMGYVGTQLGASWDEVAVGIAISLIALVRVLAPVGTATLSLVNLVLGAWMIVAPWLPNLNTGLTTGAIWNQVITGIVVAALSIWSVASSARGAQLAEK